LRSSSSETLPKKVIFGFAIDFTVKAGSEVKLNLVNKDGYSCALAFTIPKLGIRKTVRPGTSESFSFTAPKQTGPVLFSCSMGMYRGTINVIN
jgi:plastocyanin domain-containing protein